MPTRTIQRPAPVTNDGLVADVVGFLARFDDPRASDRWRGWARAARAASELRNVDWRDDSEEAALRRWESFQATHGNL